MREINAVALEITTACNLHCPECCCKMHVRPAVHHPMSYLESVAPWIHGMQRVDLTGGEPTCHPQFAEIAIRARDLFRCDKLTLETNCFQVRKYAHLLDEFDLIRVSLYPGENEEDVQWVLDRFPSYIQNGTCASINVAAPDERMHIPLSHQGAGDPCLLGEFEFALYADGKFWPCRLGPAVPGAVGIEPCGRWWEKVVELPMPCRGCFFSKGELNVQPE